MAQDRYKTTIRIPIVIEGGRPAPDGASAFPKLKDGAYGELVVPSEAVEDKDERASLLERNFEPLLATATPVLVLVRVDPHGRLPDALERALWRGDGPGPCVEVLLRQELRLVRRGAKKPSLAPCKCFIPSLGKDAISLNHACTLISMAFELWRISHAGNAFQLAYFQDRGRWTPLEKLRARPANSQ